MTMKYTEGKECDRNPKENQKKTDRKPKRNKETERHNLSGPILSPSDPNQGRVRA